MCKGIKERSGERNISTKIGIGNYLAEIIGYDVALPLIEEWLRLC